MKSGDEKKQFENNLVFDDFSAIFQSYSHLDGFKNIPGDLGQALDQPRINPGRFFFFFYFWFLVIFRPFCNMDARGTCPGGAWRPPRTPPLLCEGAPPPRAPPLKTQMGFRAVLGQKMMVLLS